jgi:micrococcal nuclease
MKPFLVSIFILFSCNAFAQEPKTDSTYFLIDTTKTNVTDRMWIINGDNLYKNYTLQCPCLKFNGMPTFFYQTNDKFKFIDKAQLKAIKLISLPALIIKAKQLLDTSMISRLFFVIEPDGKKYVMHNVALINPAIQITSPPDVIEFKPDSSLFMAKGLITVESKKLAGYIDQSVITSGIVANTKVNIDSTIQFEFGTPYPNQDFLILIEKENTNKFDLPETFFTHKKIKVTGKVIDYKGKPAIIVSDPRQILWIRKH